MDRRALFFLFAAVVCGMLAPVTDREYRWVPLGLVVLYALLALASFADSRSQRRNGAERDPPPVAE
jgi:Ca2+/Na+ antiporter